MLLAKFTVQKADLFPAVNVVARNFMFTSHATTVLKSFYFEVSAISLSFTAMDGYSELNIRNIPIIAKTQEFPVSFLIENSMLQKILMSTSKETILFEISDDGIKVKTESTYRLPHLPINEYPKQTLSVDGMGEPTVLTDLEFLKVLDIMTPFVTNELVRPNLAGIGITDHVYVSTDGICGLVHKRVEDSLGRMTLYPYFIKIISAIPNLKNFNFYRSDTACVIEGNDFIYRGRLPVAEFPYTSIYQVLEQREKARVKVSVNSSAFFSALDRVTLVADDRFSQIRIYIDKNGLELSHMDEKSNAFARETIPLLFRHDGEGNNIAENPNDDVLEAGISVLLSLNAIESCKKVYQENDLAFTFTYIDDKSTIFLHQEASKYLFFTTPMRRQ